MARFTSSASGLGLGKLILRGASGYGRIHGALVVRLGVASGALETFLWQALTLEEKASLALEMYGHRSTVGPVRLYPWEEHWYRCELPPAPAHILVGGAGSGREMLALLAAGYTVSGFEPAVSLCESARRQLPGHVQFWRLSYEGLIAAPVDAPPARYAPYDAVLLGWGSFSHVLDPSLRERLIRVIDQLSPTGPLLLSFLLEASTQPNKGKWQRRSEHWGRQVARVRGLAPTTTAPDRLFPHAGFVHQFSRNEVESLAALVGRTARWGQDGREYPHCSFVTALGARD